MVYNTQNLWYRGLGPSPGIIKTRKDNFSETECFRPQLGGRKPPTVLRVALSRGPNRVMSPSLHLRAETDPVSDNLCFLDRKVAAPV
jgi:hypothetical protein